MNHFVAWRLKDLALRDWLALLVVGPLLGWGLVEAVTTSHNEFVAGHALAMLMVGASAIGGVIGVITPRLHGVGAALVMAPVVARALFGFATEPEKHNVIGGEIVIFLWFTGIAVGAGWASADVLRSARERRRARLSQ